MASLAGDGTRDRRGLSDDARRYTRVAIALHWLIALVVVSNLFIGWRMVGAEGMRKFTLFQLHKSVGITVLLLTIVRLGWRLAHRAPAYPDTMAVWEKVSARLVHALFYVLMLAMPLTGWVIVSASPLNLPTLLYGSVPWPHLGFVHELSLDSRKAIESGFGSTHVLLAYLFAGLIVLHVAAALKHHLVQRDNVLRSMAPWRSRRSPALSPERD